ncbi:DUF4442 domain-containing protein [Aureisphaera galaxeae]|uniref:DUF4442 domain-containing protein n=1 Tax=Aureisphaera galaxeae TaxID=1538023 RepID=UPI002350EA4D|nr:DUF4442 domain-containing protein [Aureisphaera galaxeae]MDC8004854.1 DUF4442 domain-containing protein [Aureisphaera galaxeae]
MSFYQKIAEVGTRFVPKHKLFRYGFNWSPMYRRSTGRVVSVTKDLLNIRIKVRLSYKNRNYVNSIFGGSMFSSVDPIPMVQLINLLGNEYVVWDKSAEVVFKRPARENLYADFLFTEEELAEIKQRIAQEQEIEIVKTTQLTNENRSTVYCEVHKTMYVANKSYYKEKRKNKTGK